MVALVNALELQILDDLLGNAVYLPNPVYIGLMTTQPNEDGSGVVEPVGNGYARVSVANTLAEWPAATLVGQQAQKTHANDIAFPQATGSWGTMTHAGIFDAASGGNLRLYGGLDISRIIANQDIFRFIASFRPLILTLD